MENRKLRCWFRLVRIPSDMLVAFKVAAGEHHEDLREAPHFSGEGMVASFLIEPGRDYQWVHSFLREHQVRDGYGTFVSLRTDLDSDIVTVPEHVVQFIRLVGGTLEFSFTSIAED